ncbi:leucine--tRNA ligase [Candidatus Saccharibacteria bacterium]|jgi:leucyl-tRNA synthetase|nr:leucine--tRNA ligase [Candidatus Saccharibacteria bacterium]MBP9131885.1 leucine--tRNA ligase [Candidatus Saccharibacteria bacterium]
MQRFEPKIIEPKWQKIWDETGLYKADLDSDKEKYIAMSMFNYPSGNLHIGHAMNYTIPDIMARFKRQQGYESYHPVGWDSFGLPAENRAIKEGMSPQQSMAQLIPQYQTAYKAMGWSNDWDKEIATHLPEYYRWTQWIFSEMYREGLAYQDSRMQWWCTKCQTVLANEQVIDGKCWRHDGPGDLEVKRKEVKQWFFKITEYADELLEAIDDLDWTGSVKLAQKNWIGRSEGVEVTYKIKDSKDSVSVFTVAHDTMFGTTFMVLAPEHDLVDVITTAEHKDEVSEYVRLTNQKSEVERQSDKSKTGVFTGAYAINPLTDKEVPIWIADYVLAGYGTGAVMGVPGEDERDYEFANKFDLEIIYTTEQQEFIEYEDIKKSPENYKLANSGEFDGMTFKEGRNKILEKLVALEAGKKRINYKMRDWSISRQRYWGAPIPIVNCQSCVSTKEKFTFEYNNENNFNAIAEGKKSVLTRASDHEIAQAKIGDTLSVTHKDKKVYIKIIGRREYDSLEKRFDDTEWLNRSLTKKFNSLQSLVEYYETTIPSYLKNIKGKSIIALEFEILTVPVLISDDNLPVVLPELDDFQPSGDGRSALARADEWIKTTCPNCGGKAERETDTLDTYICSSWYMLRYFDPANNEQAFSPVRAKKWMPIDFYNGADHATAHLLYARFVTRFFYKKGLVNDPEPFKKFLFNGKVTAGDGTMFSKSKGNGVDPLEIINSGYGADALRLYLMFAAPLEVWAKWNPSGVPGTYRFLNRVWDIAQEVIASKEPADDKQAKNQAEHETHLLAEVNKTIKKVTEDLEKLSFNTAIAKLMELNKYMRKIADDLPYNSPAWLEAIEKNILLLAPFAPHMSEELWQQFGHDDSIHKDSWPTWDKELVKEDLITVVVQVNGKLRAELILSADASKEELITAAATDEKVNSYIKGKEIRKTIVVPGRLINFVV